MKEVVQELKKREDLKRPLEQTVLPSIDDFKKDESPKRQKTDLSRNDLLLQKIKNNDPEIVKLDLICEKDSNFVSNLIKALKENTLVKEIVLYKTSLDNESIKNLSSIINSNKITHLDLTNILLDKEEIEILSNALVNNKSLNHLALILIPMEMESLRKLIENIKSTNLSTLTLWGNNFGDSGAEIITELFYSDSPIKYLNIGSNNISKAGAEIIARNIIAAKLIELNIENNDIKEGVINLLTALENNQYIKKLMLSNIGISKKSIEAIKKFLITTSITELDLEGNNLSNYIDKLATALKQNKWLKSLNLSNTGLNHQNIEELTLALKENKTLEVLAISHNHDIGNLGIKKIADFILQENNFLKNLVLSNIGAEDQDAEYIAEILLKKASLSKLNLEILDLTDNYITILGAEKLEIVSGGVQILLDDEDILKTNMEILGKNE